MQLSDKADLAVSCVDLPEAAGVDGATWEAFQLRLLNYGGRFGIDVKSRQIAWSFSAALDAICDGLLHPNTPHTFVSINQDEATEKIRYAKMIIDHWHAPPGYPKPILTKDTMGEIHFSNGSRLISFPCRPPRGKARDRIYLDEMAHYRTTLDREIYRASLPATIKGDGYIRIGSSPLGAGGLFWEIATEAIREYPGYNGHRQYIPWWGITFMCKDIKTAQQVAPTMPTEERVMQFGTNPLLEIYQNMFIEDFKQEHECDWVDESVAWHPWEIIKRNRHEELDWFYARGLDKGLLLIDEIKAAIQAGTIEDNLYVGIDIGRHHDLTEIIAVGKTSTRHLPLRVRISLPNVEHPDQEELVIRFLKEINVTRCLIDDSGMGGPLAEKAKRETRKAQGVDFTNANKEAWAVETKTVLEDNIALLPMEKDLSYQIHSIKRRVTATKMYAFDAERNEKGHADAYWAWALAIWAAHTKGHGRGVVF